jgi:hypothetical protein
MLICVAVCVIALILRSTVFNDRAVTLDQKLRSFTSKPALIDWLRKTPIEFRDDVPNGVLTVYVHQTHPWVVDSITVWIESTTTYSLDYDSEGVIVRMSKNTDFLAP